jgi:type I restriction enzyme S subunit
MNGFSETTIGQIITLQRGFDITKKEQTPGEVPIVSSSGVSSYHNVAKVKGPGVVIGRKGTLGTSHFIKQDFWPHDTSLWVKDFKGNDPRFISYFLKTLKLENFDTGSSNPTLNRNHVHKIKVFFPDCNIQKKVAAVTSAYDDLIENNKRRIALLEKMAEEIYREWFVRFRFLGYQKAKFDKGIPKGWEVKSVGDVYKTSSGGTPSRKNASNYGDEINWLKTGELKNIFAFDSDEKITQQGLESSSAKLFPENTVVIAMYCAMADITILATPSATNQACCAFLPKEKYLSHIYTYYLIKFVQGHMIQYAHGAAQQNLSQGLIQGFNLLVADKDTITNFTEIISPLFSEIQNLMKVNSKLIETKNKLLPRLISGKLSVVDLDIQFPASMFES